MEVNVLREGLAISKESLTNSSELVCPEDYAVGSDRFTSKLENIPHFNTSIIDPIDEMNNMNTNEKNTNKSVTLPTGSIEESLNSEKVAILKEAISLLARTVYHTKEVATQTDAGVITPESESVSTQTDDDPEDRIRKLEDLIGEMRNMIKASRPSQAVNTEVTYIQPKEEKTQLKKIDFAVQATTIDEKSITDIKNETKTYANKAKSKVDPKVKPVSEVKKSELVPTNTNKVRDVTVKPQKLIPNSLTDWNQVRKPKNTTKFSPIAMVKVGGKDPNEFDIFKYIQIRWSKKYTSTVNPLSINLNVDNLAWKTYAENDEIPTMTFIDHNVLSVSHVDKRDKTKNFYYDSSHVSSSSPYDLEWALCKLKLGPRQILELSYFQALMSVLPHSNSKDPIVDCIRFFSLLDSFILDNCVTFKADSFEDVKKHLKDMHIIVPIYIPHTLYDDISKAKLIKDEKWDEQFFSLKQILPRVIAKPREIVAGNFSEEVITLHNKLENLLKGEQVDITIDEDLIKTYISNQYYNLLPHSDKRFIVNCVAEKRPRKYAYSKPITGTIAYSDFEEFVAEYVDDNMAKETRQWYDSSNLDKDAIYGIKLIERIVEDFTRTGDFKRSVENGIFSFMPDNAHQLGTCIRLLSTKYSKGTTNFFKDRLKIIKNSLNKEKVEELLSLLTQGQNWESFKTLSNTEGNTFFHFLKYTEVKQSIMKNLISFSLGIQSQGYFFPRWKIEAIVVDYIYAAHSFPVTTSDDKEETPGMLKRAVDTARNWLFSPLEKTASNLLDNKIKSFQDDFKNQELWGFMSDSVKRISSKDQDLVTNIRNILSSDKSELSKLALMFEPGVKLTIQSIIDAIYHTLGLPKVQIPSQLQIKDLILGYIIYIKNPDDWIANLALLGIIFDAEIFVPLFDFITKMFKNILIMFRSTPNISSAYKKCTSENCTPCTIFKTIKKEATSDDIDDQVPGTSGNEEEEQRRLAKLFSECFSNSPNHQDFYKDHDIELVKTRSEKEINDWLDEVIPKRPELEIDKEAAPEQPPKEKPFEWTIPNVACWMWNKLKEYDTEALGLLGVAMVASVGYAAAYNKFKKPNFSEIAARIVEFSRNINIMNTTLIALPVMFYIIVGAFKWLLSVIKGTEDPRASAVDSEIAKWLEDSALCIPTELNAAAVHAPLRAYSYYMDIYHRGLDLSKKTHRASPRYGGLFKDKFRQVSEQYTIQESLHTMHVGKFEPFHVQLYSDPGVGKTNVTDKLIVPLAKALNITQDDTPPSVYMANPSTEHFDTYIQQEVAVYDDVNYLTEDATIGRWLNIIAGQPTVIPMAALHDKGKTLALKLVLSNTNKPFHRDPTVNNIEAIWRRRILVRAYRVRELSKNESVNDLWLDVLRFDVLKATDPNYTALYSKLTFKELGMYLERMAHNHRIAQEHKMASKGSYASIKAYKEFLNARRTEILDYFPSNSKVPYLNRFLEKYKAIIDTGISIVDDEMSASIASSWVSYLSSKTPEATSGDDYLDYKSLNPNLDSVFTGQGNNLESVKVEKKAANPVALSKEVMKLNIGGVLKDRVVYKLSFDIGDYVKYSEMLNTNYTLEPTEVDNTSYCKISYENNVKTITDFVLDISDWTVAQKQSLYMYEQALALLISYYDLDNLAEIKSKVYSEDRTLNTEVIQATWKKLEEQFTIYHKLRLVLETSKWSGLNLLFHTITVGLTCAITWGTMYAMGMILTPALDRATAWYETDRKNPGRFFRNPIRRDANATGMFTLEDAEEKAIKSMQRRCIITNHNGSGSSRVQLIRIGGDMVLVPGHTILDLDNFISGEIKIEDPCKVAFRNTTKDAKIRDTIEIFDTFNFVKKDIYAIPNRDAMVISVKGYEVAKKRNRFISKNDLRQEIFGGSSSYAFSRGEDSWDSINIDTIDLREQGTYYTKDKNGKDYPVTNSKYFFGQNCSGNYKKGYSGSLVAHRNNHIQRKFLGITGGASFSYNEIYVVPVTKEDIDAAYEYFNRVGVVVTIDEPPLRADAVSTGDLEFDYQVNVVCDNPYKYSIPAVTKFKPSPIQQLGIFPVDTSPAILSAGDRRFARDDPILKIFDKIGVEKYSKSTRGGDFENIIKSARELAKRDSSFLKQIRLYSITESIRGCKKEGSSTLDLGTAAGIPWSTMTQKPGKKGFITLDDYGDVLIDPYLVETVQDLWEELAEGNYPMRYAQMFLKDETLPNEKVFVKPKTRTVTAMPLDVTVVAGMLFGDVNRMFRITPIIETRVAAGYDPASLETNDLVNWYQYWDNMICLDVKNWDGWLPATVLIGVAEYYYESYRLAYFARGVPLPANLKTIIYTFVIGQANAYIAYNTKVFRTNHGMKSGERDTLVKNSIAHKILTYMFYCNIMKKNNKAQYCTVMQWEQIMRSQHCGDDVIHAVNPQFAHLINPTSLANEYQNFGAVVTASDKTENYKWDTIYTAQFLKCNYANTLGRWHIKPAESIINNLLTWVSVSSHRSPKEQFEDNIVNAKRFAYWHGPLYYEVLCDKIEKACLQISFPITPISYEAMGAWIQVGSIADDNASIEEKYLLGA